MDRRSSEELTPMAEFRMCSRCYMAGSVDSRNIGGLDPRAGRLQTLPE
jgi:hypothetical protein